MSPTKRKTPLPKRRPTETISGIGGLLVTYGFLTGQGVSEIPAALLAIGAGLVPALVTYLHERTF